MKRPIPFGKYYLLDRISVGGMAEVFKAKAFGVEGFERLIAVKRILPSIAEDEEFITMFIDEAKIAVQLQHANIAQIFDLGKVGDSYFIAMEYVPGKDVRTIFDRLRKLGRTMAVPMACYITMKMCEGLDYAHNKKDGAGRDLNLVHRDVSPQNVLISFDGEVKIIDFGIAKAAGKAGKTQAGILKGKFGYMSPEQVRGLPLDRRSDIFAVGICLWEMVTGERLFIGQSDFSTLEKVRNVEINPPTTINSKISAELEEIILKALAKEVEDRYQSALDFHDDLQSWMYTSGNFFARKDLVSFQNDVFREDIDKERASNETGPIMAPASVPPSAPPGAPVRVSAPPPPPRGQSGPRPGPKPSVPPPLPSQRVSGVPTGHPGAPHGGTGPGSSMDQLAAPQGSGVSGRAAIAMDWNEEEEPPTNIYSKKAAAEMAKAVVSNNGQPVQQVQLTHPDLTAQSAYGGVPVGSVVMPMPAPKRSAVPMVATIAILAILGVVGVFAYKYLFGDTMGTLELSVEPPDELEVVIDGSQVLAGSDSPFLPQLTSGRHVLTVKRKGYKTQKVEIEIDGGSRQNHAITLEQDPSGFFLDTEPPGASVWIDERPIEDKTPVTVDNLKPGTYMVRVAKGDSFKQKSIEVVVAPGEINRLPTKVLELEAVELQFNTSPAGAETTLIWGSNRKKLGPTPVTAVLDPAKEYKVSFSKDGHKTQTLPVEYDTSKEKVVLATITLEESSSGGSKSPGPRAKPRSGKMGMLSVQTRPWSKVFINGKFIRNTPVIKHKLMPGAYTVTVENPTYSIKRSFRVQIKAGKVTPLVKTLM